MQLLGIDIPTLRRDPHYFLPTTGGHCSASVRPANHGCITQQKAQALLDPHLHRQQAPIVYRLRTRAVLLCFLAVQATGHSDAHLQDCRWQGFAPLQAVDLIAGLSARAVPLAAGDRYLLFGSDQQHMKAQFLKFFSTADWEANQRLQVRSPSSACLSVMQIVLAGLS